MPLGSNLRKIFAKKIPALNFTNKNRKCDKYSIQFIIIHTCTYIDYLLNVVIHKYHML